jgi:tRNA (cmo5U34)-methyltransferase
MTTRTDTVWQGAELARNFVSGVRGSIPLSGEQIDVMLRVIAKACSTDVTRFLDLGCGDGILGHAILNRYPSAQGVFSDFSEPMLEAARERLAEFSGQQFLPSDYAISAWVEDARNFAPFDVVVSGFSIHHQPDERKREVYQEIYTLLRPGGVFLNLEHVSSPDAWVSSMFDDLMVDSQFAYFQANGDARSREEIADTYYYRPDKAANILAPVEDQCRWLREIGYHHVDCYLKIFELALFGGVKPEGDQGG